MAPDGWLALAGLFWLEPGANAFGSAAGNAVVFPEKAPATLGHFLLENDTVWMKMAAGEKATVDGTAVDSLLLTGHDPAPMIKHGDFSWILIQRTDKFGIRLWDTQHPKLSDTLHIDHYPVDQHWRIPAHLIKDSKGKTVRIRNVLDMEMEMETEGRLQFEYGGEVYEITALEGGEDSLFLIFMDATSGSETYSGGRYLYVPIPDSEGNTYLDFNKAYNPPCAFTDFATCLLPPPENRLELAITAGELNYGDH